LFTNSSINENTEGEKSEMNIFLTLKEKGGRPTRVETPIFGIRGGGQESKNREI
jgi:hypothetical protein